MAEDSEKKKKTRQRGCSFLISASRIHGKKLQRKVNYKRERATIYKSQSGKKRDDEVEGAIDSRLRER